MGGGLVGPSSSSKMQILSCKPRLKAISTAARLQNKDLSSSQGDDIDNDEDDDLVSSERGFRDTQDEPPCYPEVVENNVNNGEVNDTAKNLTPVRRQLQ